MNLPWKTMKTKQKPCKIVKLPLDITCHLTYPSAHYSWFTCKKKLYWCIRVLIFGDAPRDLLEKVLIFCDFRAKFVHFLWLTRKKGSFLAKVLIFRNIQTCCTSALHLDVGSWYRQLYKYNILSSASASALYKDRSWDLVQTAGEDWLRQLPQVLFEQACKDHRDHHDHRDHRDGIKSSYCFVDVDMVNWN